MLLLHSNLITKFIQPVQTMQRYIKSKPEENAYWKSYLIFIDYFFKFNSVLLSTAMIFSMTWSQKLGFLKSASLQLRLFLSITERDDSIFSDLNYFECSGNFIQPKQL
jgi:hypothetical protein